MRKRMIDPHFWESAQIKQWTAADCTVMLAAISAADDEGRGRIKSITDNISGIISTKKFKKSCQNLRDSIVFYSNLFYFLPNWQTYQSVSHPIKSKFPEPNLLINKELGSKNSGTIPETFQSDSDTVKVSLKEYSLKEFKVGEASPTNNVQPSNSDLPLPLPTENQSTEPQDYENIFQVTDSIKTLLFIHCNIHNPDKATLSSLVNLVMKTNQVRNSTAFKHLRDTLIEFKSLPVEKQNLKYIYSRTKGRINDLLIKRREELAQREKDQLKNNIDTISKSADINIEQIANKFQIN